MKKVFWLLITLFVLSLCLYGWYTDLKLLLTPSYVVFNDSENTLYGYGIYTFEGGAKFFFSRYNFVDGVVKDNLIVGTNMTNGWELRRLAWSVGTEFGGDRFSWNIVVGRQQAKLDDGVLLSRVSDGISGHFHVRTVRVDATVGYTGWTQERSTNMSLMADTNHRVIGGVMAAMPVWFFSFVRVGTAGSVDLRTNFSSSFGVFFAGVQGALGEWFGYQAKAWYEMGSIVLTNLSKPDPVSAWASEASLFVGKKGFPIQGRMRLFLASGEGKADGWNRFVPLGEMESSQVLLHPAGNLTLVQMQATWRTLASRLGVSLGYDLLWRQEKQDITLVSLYGDGLFLGQEFVL